MKIKKWVHHMIKICLFVLIFLLVLSICLLCYRSIVQQQIKQQSTAIIENGGISELKEITVNGGKQFILVEGQDKERPFCLFLHGGPGSPFPYGVSARTLFPEITENCVAVFYDQRGSGKSYNKNLSLNTMNLAQFTEDANSIVDFIRVHYKQEKIFIIGQSFGTVIGTQLIARYPEKFHAYLGISQLTNPTKGQELGYEWLKNEAQAIDDEKTLRILESFEKKPYLEEDEDQFSKLINQYKGMNYSDDTIEKVNLFNLIKGAFTSPDYSLQDIYHAFISGPQFSLIESKELKKEIILTNFFETVKTIEIPVYLIHGIYDKQANYELSKQYYEILDAPNGKEFITLQHSAHYPNKLDVTLINDTLKKMLERY